MRQQSATESRQRQAVLGTYRDAMARYSLGMSTVVRLARESGALRKIGKAARVDLAAMDAYIRTFEG
jgi:hypothetical protein